MRLALICTEKLPVPPIRGGAIQILIDGVSRHLKSRHSLTIYNVADPDLPEREVRDGIEYVRVPREDYVFRVAAELSKLQAEKQPFDLVHVFNRPKDVLVYKSAMPDSRFVVSLHNEMFKEGKISKELGELAIRAVDNIMSISNYIGRTITDRFPSAKRKVVTVYSGIDLNRYHPLWTSEAQPIRGELRKKYGVDDKKVVLFVGRLSAVKGPDILIRAMQQVTQEHPDSALVLVGSKWFSDDRIDDYGKMLRELAQTLGEDRVIFTGFVSPAEIPSHFLLGDMFVCSSQWQEPLARVHYEAMGTGLPVITTDRGGNAEIIRHGVSGLVITDYSNPQAFAEAISSLLSNPDLTLSLGREGRKAAERHFGFEHVMKRLEKLYLGAMRRKKQEES